MRYGVFSDVHSNLEALEAVLKELRARKVDGYIVLGDHVGYGPDPDACLAKLSALKPCWAVNGNHDLAAIEKMDFSWFNPIAAEALQWTRDHLSYASRQWLESLPDKIEDAAFTAVHGSPRNPPEEYMLTPRQFVENIPHVKHWPCFVGHSHLPLYFKVVQGKEGKGEVKSELVNGDAKLRLSDWPCLINPGSVGQPRDLDPRASCGVFDTKARTFEWVRVSYPIAEVQKKIRAAKLPYFLAERLNSGR